MFTGIVAFTGEIKDADRTQGLLRVTVTCPEAAEDLQVGDSVAVNGVCLTAVELDGQAFIVEIVEETLSRTTLGALDPGDLVNLELPLRPADRLGGHFVQGHVDGTVELVDVTSDGDARIMTWRGSPELMPYVIEKGSVALDGVSLTVAAVTDSTFSVAVIPHTLAVTSLGRARPRYRANFEADLIAKYVEKLSVKPPS